MKKEREYKSKILIDASIWLRLLANLKEQANRDKYGKEYFIHTLMLRLKGPVTLMSSTPLVTKMAVSLPLIEVYLPRCWTLIVWMVPFWTLKSACASCAVQNRTMEHRFRNLQGLV
mgnify:CR=1 FL=1